MPSLPFAIPDSANPSLSRICRAESESQIQFSNITFPSSFRIFDMAAYDDLDVKRIFVVGIASVVVTAVTALAVQVVYYTMAEQQKAETAAASNYMRQNAILDAQKKEIEERGVDESTGRLVIPVDDAIRILSTQANTDESPST